MFRCKVHYYDNLDTKCKVDVFITGDPTTEGILKEVERNLPGYTQPYWVEYSNEKFLILKGKNCK